MRQSGFTLIELLVALAIISVLAAAAFPLSEMSARRMQEKELREALWALRGAIDAYKQASDDGKIQRSATAPGYPPDLRTLVNGVTNARDPVGGKLYFLRKIPRNPFAEAAASAEDTWGKRSYQSSADDPKPGADVFDVYALTRKTGLNGVPYREW